MERNVSRLFSASRRSFLSAGAAAAAALWLPACGSRERPKARKLLIGFVAKCRTNPVFVAAEIGAREAAADLGKKYGIEIETEWRTPLHEDAAKQAEAIEALARAGAAGIALSCTDAEVLTPAIDRAVGLGTAVFCFDSDAPRSKRFGCFGADDEAAGAKVVEQLAKDMDGKGAVAILAGTTKAPNLTARLDGATEELKDHPEMRLVENGVVHNEESPEKAAAAVARTQAANPAIEGWCFLGGWPLNAPNALPWKPGEVKVAALDALPLMLAYLESGHVNALFLQHCHEWGVRSLKTLIRKILLDETPEPQVSHDDLDTITRENAKKCASDWDRWLGKKVEPEPTEKTEKAEKK
jgi:ribose transport system substrate-binding protein